MSNQIRPLAICIFRDGDRILVGEGYDPVKRETFYRPLGGGIEFGERAEEALRREVREEIGAEIESPVYLFTLENIFTFNGEEGHEIVMIFDARFLDEDLYTQDSIAGTETVENRQLSFKAVWMRLDAFGPNAPLYPDGLLDALREDLSKAGQR
ncbi:MAG: NUDIX domain-containing protein [Anaerolineaceae bacterium]|nr:MAG: NUDIX domain-containing protein [Anaerolineaceae bacterium]